MRNEVLFRLPYEVISLNKWQRMHWAERKRHEKMIGNLLAVSCLETPYEDLTLFRSFTPLRKSELEIIAFRRRPLDPDNVCVKALVDVLKKADIIVDDSGDHVSLKVSSIGGHLAGNDPFTMVYVRWEDEENPRNSP